MNFTGPVSSSSLSQGCSQRGFCAELGCSSLRSVGAGLHIPPCRPTFRFAWELTEYKDVSLIQKNVEFRSEFGVVFDSFRSVTIPFLLWCCCCDRAWSSLALTDTEVIKAVKVHVNTSTSFQIHIYSSPRSK